MNLFENGPTINQSWNKQIGKTNTNAVLCKECVKNASESFVDFLEQCNSHRQTTPVTATTNDTNLCPVLGTALKAQAELRDARMNRAVFVNLVMLLFC
jgi:hypothetical protein